MSTEMKGRRESDGAEVLGLTEALARIRTDGARAADGLREVEGRRRLGVLAAVSGDGEADGEMDRLDAKAADLRRRAVRLVLAAEVARERLDGLGAVLAETSAGPRTEGGT